MTYVRFTITEPFRLSVKIPLIAANWAARAVGAAMVLGPAAALAAIITAKPSEHVLTLPLPVKEVAAERYRTVNDRELDCLANNIYFEARNQSQLGQIAVGLVTVTRAERERWPKTICGVVYDHKQFTWTWDKKQKLGNHVNSIQYLHALNLASRILYGDFDSMREAFVADHYHTTKVHPKWANKLEKVVTLDDHIFYVDR